MRRLRKSLNSPHSFLDFRKISESVPAMIAVYNIRTGKYLYVNSAVRKLLGFAPEEFIKGGLPMLSSLVHPNDLPRILAENNSALEVANKNTHPKDGEPIINFEYRMKNKNGFFRWLHTDGSVYSRDKNGKVEYVLNISLDITKRKEAENAIKRSKDEEHSYFSEIIESSDDAIISKTLNGIITSWNRSAEKMFGYKNYEAIGNPITIIIPPELHIEEKEIISRLKRGIHITHYETVRVRKDGKKVNVSLTISPIKNHRGKIVGASKIARDITNQKALEKQKDDLIGITSHELKTPLTSIKAYVQILEKRLAELKLKELKYMTNRIDKQINNLTALIADLLDVTKIQAGKVILKKEKFILNDMVKEYVKDVIATAETIKKRKLSVQIIEDNIIEIVADKYRIGQVMTNLLTNAVRYSPKSNKIVIRITKDKSYGCVSVQDFGVGISEENQAKVFERFFRADPTVGQNKILSSLGLGLFISSEIVKQHEGKIWIDSKEGKGSTFSFCIPLNEHSESQLKSVK